MSLDHLNRLVQHFGLDKESRRGKRALTEIAVTLTPSPATGSQKPIKSQLPRPFDHLRFTAKGVGFIEDKDGFLRSVTEYPFVKMADPHGNKWVYRKTRFGIVRRFQGDEPPRPLTPQDASILEAAATETLILKFRRDQQKSRIF